VHSPAAIRWLGLSAPILVPVFLLARIFHAFCVLFPAFVGGQAVSLRERASYTG